MKDSYGGVSLHEQSHGESFLALMEHRFGGEGIYILDEPEAALSPTRILRLMVLLRSLETRGSQFIISTHSPILMAYPNACIYRIGEASIDRVAYTETEHYSVVRDGSLSFQRIPVDGSSKMPDDMMESIEPYDSRQAVDIQTAYLSGYLADRYDVSADRSIRRANDRIRQSTEEAFRSTVTGYSGVQVARSDIQTEF